MNYKSFCELKANDPNINIFPKPTDDAEALDILFDYLGPTCHYVCNYSCGKEQANTEFVAYVMLTHPSMKWIEYPWWKKLYIRIRCLYKGEPLYNYY